MHFIKDPNSESKNKKKLKSVRIWRFRLILTSINFRQTNAINMNFFYTRFMLGILQKTKEFSSHAIYQT